MAIKFKDEIIHDNPILLDVFINAKLEIEHTSSKLEDALKHGTWIKNGKLIEGEEYKIEIKKMERKLEILVDLFDMEKCKQYIISPSDNLSLDKEYIVHNNMEVSNKFVEFLLDNEKPLGTFLTSKNGIYIGINNLEGNVLMEKFKTKEECLNWLNDKELEEEWEPEM